MSDKILMWCAVVWLVPLMTYLMIKTARFKNNIVAGVTFGEEGYKINFFNFIYCRNSRDIYTQNVDNAYLLAGMDRFTAICIYHTILPL